MCRGWGWKQLVWVTDGVIQDCASPWCWTSDSTGTCAASVAHQPPLALSVLFFVVGWQPCPKSVQCAAYTDTMVRVSTAAWNHPKDVTSKTLSSCSAELSSQECFLLRVLKDLLSSLLTATLKHELGFKWKCSDAYSWFVIISHLQT